MNALWSIPHKTLLGGSVTLKLRFTRKAHKNTTDARTDRRTDIAFEIRLISDSTDVQIRKHYTTLSKFHG